MMQFIAGIFVGAFLAMLGAASAIRDYTWEKKKR